MANSTMLKSTLSLFLAFSLLLNIFANEAFAQNEEDERAATIQKMLRQHFSGEAITGDKEYIAHVYHMVAQYGDVKAQFKLGELYYYGEGVKQDRAKAANWYKMAAEQGHAEAQYTLGVMHDDGEGVKQNRTEAAKWYRMAAEQGHATAQIFLGALYSDGVGVKQDHAEAAKWYKMAAEQGNAVAQFIIGATYEIGDGLKQDHAEAAKWYKMAAEQGNADAQNALSRIQSENTANKQAAEDQHQLLNTAKITILGMLAQLAPSFFKSDFENEYIERCESERKYSNARCECVAKYFDETFDNKTKQLILNPNDNPFALIALASPMLDITNQCESEGR